MEIFEEKSDMYGAAEEVPYTKADPCGISPYERYYLWRDVVRVGLGQLVAVDEVLSAARKVLDEYDTLFGPPATEPEVPESFYELGPDPFAGDEDATVQDVGR